MHFVTHDGTLFFTAMGSLADGFELWKSDGTPDGTVRVKDVNPAGGSGPNRFVSTAGTLFFAAHSGDGWFKLWKSDGSETGTVQVGDVAAGHLTDFDGALVFAGYRPETGGDLWQSDGSDDGTAPLVDFDYFTANPESLTVVGDTLYFTLHTEAHGRELWKTDGTAEGTVLVKDINPGPQPVVPDLPRGGRRYGLLLGGRCVRHLRALEERWHRGRNGTRRGHQSGRHLHSNRR